MTMQNSAPPPTQALIIVAKEPQPGRVKTRLGATLGYGKAASLYRAFTSDTLRLAATLAHTTLALAYWPPEGAAYFQTLADPGIGVFSQKGVDFGARLHNAFAMLAEQGHTRLVLIGTDSPSLPVDHIIQAFALLDDPACDVVLGPCDDGGWYLMGLRQPHQALFDHIPWSTEAVYQATCDQAGAVGLRVMTLPFWYDVDTQSDLERLYHDLVERPNAVESVTLPLLRPLFMPPQPLSDGD